MQMPAAVKLEPVAGVRLIGTPDCDPGEGRLRPGLGALGGREGWLLGGGGAEGGPPMFIFDGGPGTASYLFAQTSLVGVGNRA